MKAILEFELPEDNNNHTIAVNAMGFALACWDLDQFLRDKLKYGNDFVDPDDALEKTREVLNDILHQYNISLNMIE